MIISENSIMSTPLSPLVMAACFIIRGIAAEAPIDRRESYRDIKAFIKDGHNLPEPLKGVNPDGLLSFVESIEIPDVDLIVPIHSINGFLEGTPISLTPVFMQVGEKTKAHYIVEESGSFPRLAIQECYDGMGNVEVDDIIIHYKTDTGIDTRTLDEVLRDG